MLKELNSLIEKFDHIVILRHKRPDLDAFGSQLGLKYVLQNTYPDKLIHALGEDGYSEFSYIGEIDYQVKVDPQKTLTIVVDTANFDRIETDDIVMSDTIVKLDHHQDIEDERYGVFNHVVPTCSSASELIVSIAKELNWKLDSASARSLFYGIYGDTGGFIFPNTSSDTFLALTTLRSYDWNYEDAVTKLRTYDHFTLKILAYAYQEIQIEDGTGFLVFDKKTQKEIGATANDISIIVNFLGQIKELDKWVIFNEYNTFVRVNMRSRERFDVSSIAKLYNGGGHKNASGASLKKLDQIDEVVEKLKELKPDVN